MAGKSQISGIVSPAVLSGDDVLDVVREGTTVLSAEAPIKGAGQEGGNTRNGSRPWCGRVAAWPNPSLSGVGELAADL